MKAPFTLRLIGLLLVGCPLFLNAQNNLPVAVNDTADIWPGIPITLNLLANDTIPEGMEVRVITSSSSVPELNATINPDKTVTFQLDRWGYQGEHWKVYCLQDINNLVVFASARVIFKVHDHSFAYIGVNNVSARINSSGLQFNNDSAQFEVPKGSNKTTLFSNALWIGGIDANQALHLAGEQYRQGPSGGHAWSKQDFWSGPVSDSTGYNIIQDTLWNRVWKISREEIDYHREHFWQQGYSVPKDLLEWPAHGDTTLGQTYRLAPFSDRNANGIYEPYDGDYPEIRGDQALFFIFNDDHGFHSETNGEKMTVEVHGMAYAFDCPSDTAFKNTVFLYYKLFNRSANIYNNVYLGVFADPDIGYLQDDYIGCDVERGMYYGYNGKAVDGNGQSNAYGENPPAQGVLILAGPKMDADGYDNPSFRGASLLGPSFRGNCDMVEMMGDTINMRYGPGEIYEAPFLVRPEAINGISFGDGITDNERLGMNRFMVCQPGLPGYGYLYPRYAQEFYDIMQGFLVGHVRMNYGGNGYPPYGTYGPECNYIFPGLSDTCNLGTAGLEPDGPKEWTERTAGNYPGDKRGVASIGPFTFYPGDVQELDIAFPWARGDNSSDSTGSLKKLRMVADTLRHRFHENRIPGGGLFYAIDYPSGQSISKVKVYPNPAKDHVCYELPTGSASEISLTLITIGGKTVYATSLKDHRLGRINLSGILPGFYLLKIQSGKSAWVNKVVIQK